MTRGLRRALFAVAALAILAGCSTAYLAAAITGGP